MNAEKIAIVAGSGIDLAPLLDVVHWRRSFDEIPGLMAGGVPGHELRFVGGACGSVEVLLQCGRLHAYEGFSFDAITRTVDALRDMGARAVVFTNAAGGLRAELQQGALVAADRVLPWPFNGFRLPSELSADFTVPGCGFTGPYMWMHGPCYETRAEIAALQRMGGATVGMSTAPELLRCRQLGLPAAVVSCVTNSCAVVQVLTHDHVVATARRASQNLCDVLRAALPRL